MFLIVVCLFFNSYSQTNALREQFEYAKQLFDAEQYYDVITELKRLKFFDEEKVFSFISNKLIAQSYKKGAKLNEAIQYFNLAELEAKTPEEIYSMKIETVRANILRRTTNRALQLIDNLENDIRFKNTKDELNYWRGWVFIFADEWDKAAKYFSLIDNNHELKIFCENVYDKKYSVTLAKILSAFLPGAGQFYTGNYLSGLLSLGWNVLWGYVSVNAFAEDRIFDGIMTANFLWLRFYSGNLQNAEKFAEEKNVEIINDALYNLQKNYEGLKP